LLTNAHRQRQALANTSIEADEHPDCQTSSLGDVIHMLPAITDAARAIPSLNVDWLVEEPFAPIPAWHPAVQNIISIAMRRWNKNLGLQTTWHEIKAARQTLRQKNYDLIVDSQGLLKSAIWARMAKGDRVGYDRQSIREPLASLFYDKGHKVSRQLHAIERNRQLMALALGYPLPSSGPDYGLHGLQSRLPPPTVRLPEQSIVALHGTSRDDKLWPVEGWITLANTLQTNHHTLVLPWGNDAEHQRAQHIAQHTSNAMVLPKLGLDDLASVLCQAQAVVGVDTGLLHLAAALGKPGLALYTATQPRLTGAISDCHAQSVLQNLSTPETLTPTAVAQALGAVLHK
jgi:heptosyltransferase-1